MFRSTLIYLSQAQWARRFVTDWKYAWRIASRFVAGETLGDAINVVKSLNASGINATIDHLGENVTNSDEADKATDDIVRILHEIDREKIRSCLSIKLTQIGLALDVDIGVRNLDKILSVAQSYGNFVRIDMEDSLWIDTTLEIFHNAYIEYGQSTVGIVIQSYLYRSVTDVSLLLEDRAKVRLCKGAYKEPPEIAYPKKRDVDSNFDEITKLLLEGSDHQADSRGSEDGRIPPIAAIASHDDQRLKFAKEYLAEKELPKDAIEFQMLYGIRRDLQILTVNEGYPVRVYVPFGTEWYPYFVRRLAERPANLWFFLSNLIRN